MLTSLDAHSASVCAHSAKLHSRSEAYQVAHEAPSCTVEQNANGLLPVLRSSRDDSVHAEEDVVVTIVTTTSLIMFSVTQNKINIHRCFGITVIKHLFQIEKTGPNKFVNIVDYFRHYL